MTSRKHDGKRERRGGGCSYGFIIFQRNMYLYILYFVCVCVRARARACVRACRLKQFIVSTYSQRGMINRVFTFRKLNSFELVIRAHCYSARCNPTIYLNARLPTILRTLEKQRSQSSRKGTRRKEHPSLFS